MSCSRGTSTNCSGGGTDEPEESESESGTSAAAAAEAVGWLSEKREPGGGAVGRLLWHPMPRVRTISSVSVVVECMLAWSASGMPHGKGAPVRCFRSCARRRLVEIAGQWGGGGRGRRLTWGESSEPTALRHG